MEAESSSREGPDVADGSEKTVSSLSSDRADSRTTSESEDGSDAPLMKKPRVERGSNGLDPTNELPESHPDTSFKKQVSSNSGTSYNAKVSESDGSGREERHDKASKKERRTPSPAEEAPGQEPAADNESTPPEVRAKREYNRIHAKKSRDKKKRTLEQLEANVADADREHNDLSASNSKLKDEILSLLNACVSPDGIDMGGGSHGGAATAATQFSSQSVAASVPQFQMPLAGGSYLENPLERMLSAGSSEQQLRTASRPSESTSLASKPQGDATDGSDGSSLLRALLSGSQIDPSTLDASTLAFLQSLLSGQGR